MNHQKILAFLAFLLLIGSGAYAKQQVRARFLSTENGLGSNYVRDIIQDSNGYLWMGTTGGLIRYDGYKTKLIVPSQAPNRQLMQDIRILAMKLWQDRYILLRQRSKKFSCYDIETDQFVEFKGDYQQAFNRPDGKRTDNRGNSFTANNTGDLWLTDAKTHTVTHLTGLYSEQLYRKNGSPRIAVATDRDGIIWVSTYGNGLFAFNPKTGEKTHFLKTSQNNAPLQTNFLLNVFEDKAGNLWVCQENMGVACLSKQQANTETRFFSNSDQVDHTNSIHLLTKIGDTIYVGNRRNGLKLADGLLNYQHDISSYNDDVVAACRDQQGTVWLGTRNNGVYAGTRNYCYHEQDGTSLTKGKISGICCDHEGRVWISIFNGGVDMAEPDGKGGYKFRHFFQGEHAIMNPRQMITDHHGQMWLISNEGLFCWRPQELVKDAKAYRHIRLFEQEQALDELHCILETRDHRIMAGVLSVGLAVLDNSKAGEATLTKIYNTSDGLPDNNIQQLVADRTGMVWIGTDRGLARFQLQNNTIISFRPATTLLGNMFVENAACQLNDGRLAFGSQQGIILLDPQQVKLQPSPFHLRITDIDVNGISVFDQEDGLLAAQLIQQEEIQLDYHQNVLTFYFSDFDYNRAESAKYSYRLKGYDRDWSSLSNINFASYKNLPPGHYTMEVRVQDADGEWNEYAYSLSVVINPPFWTTWWAYLIYLLIIAAAGWFVYRHFKRINDLHNRIKVEEQLTEYKIQFFTNISHEFRTPLTIIRGAMDHITENEKMPGELKQPVSSMQKSVDRLMRMINQLMTFSKLHENKLHLALEDTDIVAFARNIHESFREMAADKRINYSFATFAQSYNLYIDRSFLDKIIYNLISNAFKYTPDHRSITVRLSRDESKNRLLLTVEDTGIGVAKEKQDKLFTRFNQSYFAKDSIGIGLHLAAELVYVHHGDISYQEHPEGGSIFTISLPCDKSVYAAEDFLVTDNALVKKETVLPSSYTPTYKEVSGDPLNDQRVLIVEDDSDIINYLKRELQRYFVILQASNGQDALELIRQERPDLIISDVMMPVMNGIELTKIIRADQELADLPIILLTALQGDQQTAKGIGSGADAYITKPFSMQVLITRCRQLLEQRNKLRTSYAQTVVKSETPAIIIDEQEKRFRDQLDTWLGAHLSDSNLNIDLFAEKMGYGRTTFYKKVKKLTGKTPNDYIRSLRMEQAAEMLKDDTKTIAEVAYAIGIDDPYYFSKSFKSFYGISPSQYRKGEKPTK